MATDILIQDITNQINIDSVSNPLTFPQQENVVQVTQSLVEVIVSQEVVSLGFVISPSEINFTCEVIDTITLEDEALQYDQLVDFSGIQNIGGIDYEVIYRGDAVPATLESESLWRVRRILVSEVDGDVITKWANGTNLFDKVWDNRGSYTY